MTPIDQEAAAARRQTPAQIRSLAAVWPAWQVIVTLDCGMAESWELDAYVPALRRLVPEFCEVRGDFLTLCWTMRAPTAEGAANLTLQKVSDAAYALPIDLVEVTYAGAAQPTLVLSGAETVFPAPQWPAAAKRADEHLPPRTRLLKRQGLPSGGPFRVLKAPGPVGTSQSTGHSQVC